MNEATTDAPPTTASAEAILAQAEARMRAGLYRPEATMLFTWYVGRHCNFRCPYCTLDWEALARTPLPLGRALLAWRRWHESHGIVQICCTGAEPMCRPEVVRTLGEISRWHVLDITTNLRFPASALDVFPTPERVFFTTSYHPSPRPGVRQSVAEFRRRLATVREQGFRVTGVSVVAYPPLIPQLAAVKAEFEGAGEHFSVHLFRGEFEGRQFPDEYRPDESEALALLLGGRDQLDGARPKATFGSPCWTGSRYFLITAEGVAYRCWGAVAEPALGSFYRGEPHRAEVPHPCPVAAGCPCPELWPYHATEAEAAAARQVAAAQGA